MPPPQDQMVDWVLETIRRRESSGDYRARNPNSSASGAYQFIDSTWRSLGGARYAPRAYLASQAQQDEVARRYVQDIYRQHGDWGAVPIVWYVGHVPGNLDYVPGGGNSLSVRQYRDQWMQQLGQTSGGRAQVPTSGAPRRAGTQDQQIRSQILDAAYSALGRPYVWGGNSLAKGVDCSGLVQQAFLQAGFRLPRISAEQARFGQRIEAGDLQPGDLVSWDNSTRNDGADHVAIYIGKRGGKDYIIEAPGRGKQIRVTEMRPKGATFTRIIGAVQPNGQPAGPTALGQSGQTWSSSEFAQSYTYDAGGNASLGEFLEMDDPFEAMKPQTTTISTPSWRQGLGQRTFSRPDTVGPAGSVRVGVSSVNGSTL